MKVVIRMRFVQPTTILPVGGALPKTMMDLPRFRGEVRSWDQDIWFDGILSSSFE